MEQNYTYLAATEPNPAHSPVRAATSTTLQVGDIVLDFARHRVWQDGAEVFMTATSFKLLYVLMKNPGMVMTRDQLLDAVWGEDTQVFHRTVDASVKRLRNSLSPSKQDNPIRTVRAVGYAFDETYAQAS